jgi:hypothetical protein
MKQPAPPAKEIPLSISLFRFFVVLLAVTIGATAGVVALNQSVAMVTGKVIARGTETAFASRKSSYEQEVVVVSYTINGVEHTGKTPVPRHGGGSDLVPVRYYPALPWFVWFYTRTNANLLCCILALIFSLSGVIFSWSQARKHWEAAKTAKAKK